MIIFVLVIVMLFIASVLYRVLMEKKEVESALLADIEILERIYKADVEIERERLRNQEKISESDLVIIAKLRARNEELHKMIQGERQEKLIQSNHIRKLEKDLGFTSRRLETVLSNSYIFEKSVTECGLFDPSVQDKLKIAVRTKSERIRNKNMKAAVKQLIKC